MQVLATLAVIPGTDPPQVLAVSPTDDVWFLKAEDAPPQYKQLIEEIIKGQRLEVLGLVLVSDNWQRQD